MQKVRDLKDEETWNAHMKDSYQKVATEHSASWKSWGKTRFREGNRAETTVGAVEKGGAVMAGASGGAALFGAAVPATVVGVSAGVATAAITLWALPALAAGLATAYWGYNKNDHHKVNKEIWGWWTEHCQATGELDPKITVKVEMAKTWLCWFGDEGIFNMTQLEAKLKAAKEAFDQKFNTLKTSAAGLRQRIRAAQQLPDRQRQNLALAPLRQEEETLASKFLELGKDLAYIRYRLERNLMYHQMLELTIRSLVAHMKDKVPMLAKDTVRAFLDQSNSYGLLWSDIRNLPEV
jgi:hypothetical protein